MLTTNGCVCSVLYYIVSWPSGTCIHVVHVCTNRTRGTPLQPLFYTRLINVCAVVVLVGIPSSRFGGAE